MLLEESLVSRELSKHEVLISVSLVLLDQEVVSRRHRVMFVVLDLLNDFAEVFEELKVRRRLHFGFDLVEDGDLILANYHAL